MNSTVVAILGGFVSGSIVFQLGYRIGRLTERWRTTDTQVWYDALLRDYEATKPALEATRDLNGDLPAHGDNEAAFSAGYIYGVQETRSFMLVTLRPKTRTRRKAADGSR